LQKIIRARRVEKFTTLTTCTRQVENTPSGLPLEWSWRRLGLVGICTTNAYLPYPIWVA